MACPLLAMLITMANVGGAMTSGYPAAWAAARSRHSGLRSPMACANSVILTRLTSYGSDGGKRRRAKSGLTGMRDLAGLAVRLVAAAVGAVLLELEPVGVVPPVLAGDVVAVLALLASQRDLGPDIGGSHGRRLSRCSGRTGWLTRASPAVFRSSGGRT